MSSNVPVAGVATTAIAVAVIRARETSRADRLYTDPLAEVFVDAARRGFPAERWSRLSALVDQFYAGRTVGVRLFDDRFRAALATGVRQFVLLGAGLDTRAFRLDLPPDAVVYEIDLPELFAFKESVVAGVGAEPTCRRVVVAADLREDWRKALLNSGFQYTAPTYWVDEGSLGALTQEWSRRVVETLTDLSAPGSRFDAARLLADPDSAPYRELRRFVGGDAAPGDSDEGGFDVERWLARLGWRTRFSSWNDMVAPFGRPVAVADSRVGSIAAVRGEQ